MSTQLTPRAEQILRKVRFLLDPKLVRGAGPAREDLRRGVGGESVLGGKNRPGWEAPERDKDMARIVRRALRRETGTTALDQWIQGVARDMGGAEWRQARDHDLLIRLVAREICQTLDQFQGRQTRG